eukprot:199079-Rhodomonas_salina.1
METCKVVGNGAAGVMVFGGGRVSLFGVDVVGNGQDGVHLTHLRLTPTLPAFAVVLGLVGSGWVWLGLVGSVSGDCLGPFGTVWNCLGLIGSVSGVCLRLFETL